MYQSVSFLLALLGLLYLCVPVAPLNCTADYQCSPVTSNYNYVSCVQGTCACKSELGFDGNASSTDPCQCNPDKNVYWDGDVPFCIAFQECATNDEALERTAFLLQQVTRVYESLIFPTPTLILEGEVSISDLFSPLARGRVDPLGTFESPGTLLEYFYALAITPTTTCTAINIKDLFGVGDEVYIRVDVTFESTAGPVPFPFNLTESGRFTFDDQNRVLSTELIIHNLGKATDPPVAAQPSFIEAVCGILLVQPACCASAALDPTGYYTSFDDCINFMTTQIPFGTFDQAFSNSVSCREIHALLAIFDPVTHCPHAGKTGGGKCVDVPYADYYLENF